MRHEVILILDFGSQYTQLIARRLRELGGKTMIERGDLPVDEIRTADPIAVVLSGGPASVFETGALQVDKTIFDLGVPVLGICYGMQVTAHLLGGEVAHTRGREYGRARLEITAKGYVTARRRASPDDPAVRVELVRAARSGDFATADPDCDD